MIPSGGSVMNSRLDKKKYQYIITWERLGNSLTKMLLILSLLTIAVQSVIAIDIDILPQNITMELEGKSVVENYHYESKGQIKITADSKADIAFLRVFINGEMKEGGDNAYIELNVRNNDIIEIDGIDSEKYININIENTSENIIFPKKGMRYRIEGNIVVLGRVKLK